MAETRVSFSEIGLNTPNTHKKLRYPVLWIYNPQTGRCKRHDHPELMHEITKDNYEGYAETFEFVLVVTTNCYYSFSAKDGSLITKSPRENISSEIISVQKEGVLFRNKNMLILVNNELKEIGRRELSQEEIDDLDK
jgi:hypothetical protein